MNISPFQLERHFAKYEFDVPYQLSCSDCEPLTLSELLAMASPEMVRLWENLKLNYTDSSGHPMLRQEISFLHDGIKPEDVLVCAPEEGIFLVMNSMLTRGDHLVVISPAYQSLYEIAAAAGCPVSFWEADQGGDYRLETLKKLVTANTRMIVINFPHNPTGKMISREDFLELSQMCESRNIFLFSDEMYRGLEQDPACRLPSAASISASGISLSGMSKSFALPGLRIGWLVCRNHSVLEKLIQLKDYTTICASAPSEIMAIIALQNRERIIDRNLSIIRRNIRLVNDFIARHQDRVSWNSPNAGSVALLKLLTGKTAELTCRELLEKKEVLAIGSYLFNYPTPAIRLGLGRIDFPRALDKLEEYLTAPDHQCQPESF